jgi:hypothetical protein
VVTRAVVVALVVGFAAHRLGQSNPSVPRLGTGPLLAPALRIVDPSIAHGRELAESLRAGGIGVETFSPQALLGETTPGTWWITKDAAEIVEPADVQKLLDAGSNVLLDGVTPMSSALLGLQCSAQVNGTNVVSMPCEKAKTTRPTELAFRGDTETPLLLTASQAVVGGHILNWNKPAQRATPAKPGLALASMATGEPILWRSPAGNILWSMPSLSGERGPRELPYLLQALEEAFGISPRVELNGWDIYADPDDYLGQSPKQLAAAWKTAGVRRVYIAGWKQNHLARTRYDYKTLVGLLHQRGIQAFAWLGWPYIDVSTLTEYPECQDRTASGQLAQFGGQGFVALAIPECFEHAWARSSDLLKSAPFDGVNIANLAFSSPYSGYLAPDSYTPFHPLVRAEFIRVHGFDPVTLVRPGPGNGKHNDGNLVAWETYRAELLTTIYEKLLHRLVATWPKRLIAVTAMDDRNDPATGALLRRNSGRSTDALVALSKKYPFELVLGDELDFRKQEPGDVMKHYAPSGKLRPSQMLSLGKRNPNDHQLTPRLSGLELYGQIHKLALVGDRVALNPKGALDVVDLNWVKFALPPPVELRVEGDKIFTTSKRQARVLLRGRARGITLDGKVMAPGNWVDVPAGEHLVAVQR